MTDCRQTYTIGITGWCALAAESSAPPVHTPLQYSVCTFSQMITQFTSCTSQLFLCKLFCLIRYQSFYQTPYGKTNIYSQYNIPYLIYVIYNSRHDKKNRHGIYYKPYDSAEKHPYPYRKSPTYSRNHYCAKRAILMCRNA